MQQLWLNMPETGPMCLTSIAVKLFQKPLHGNRMHYFHYPNIMSVCYFKNWLITLLIVSCSVIREHEKIQVSLSSNGCNSSPRNRVIFLEHVQAIVTLSSTRRGELQVR